MSTNSGCEIDGCIHPDLHSTQQHQTYLELETNGSLEQHRRNRKQKFHPDHSGILAEEPLIVGDNVLLFPVGEMPQMGEVTKFQVNKTKMENLRDAAEKIWGVAFASSVIGGSIVIVLLWAKLISLMFGWVF